MPRARLRAAPLPAVGFIREAKPRDGTATAVLRLPVYCRAGTGQGTGAEGQEKGEGARCQGEAGACGQGMCEFHSLLAGRA